MVMVVVIVTEKKRKNRQKNDLTHTGRTAARVEGKVSLDCRKRESRFKTRTVPVTFSFCPACNVRSKKREEKEKTNKVKRESEKVQ